MTARFHALFLWLLVASAASARSPAREELRLTNTWDVGLGRSVFVVGNHADLGSWDPAQGVKLRWTPGHVWTGAVAVQCGTALEYKFIARTNSADAWCNAANAEWMPGANLSNDLPAQPAAPYAGKTIYYRTRWTNAYILYKQVVGTVTNWVDAEMTRAGAGRDAGEYTYRLSGIGEAGEGLEFVPHGYLAGVEDWDNPPYGDYGLNYYTALDVFFIQDTNVFNYWPPDSVSVSRITKTNVTSSFSPPVGSRAVWIYVPRGYDQNTWKRYPVLYMHDGTNVFSPGGYYGCWGAESAATREIGQGRMRECLIVGVDNSTNRSREYIPPGDDSGAGPGFADQYGNFLVHNVRPTIDFHFRTLNDLDNTLLMGSSFGGLVSFYLGLETNTFGKIGALSTAFWPASNFVSRIYSNQTRGIRVYMDMGTAEPSLWDENLQVYDLLLEDGYAVNNDLLLIVGCGDEHNEAAWSNRIGGAYRYLLSPWDEPNRLAQQEYPPSIAGFQMAASASSATCALKTLKGYRYRLDRAAQLAPPDWTGAFTGSVESLPWSEQSLIDSNIPPSTAERFYRILGEPQF